MSRTLSASETVGSIAAGVGGAARVFEELGIDYCCGGRRPLEQVCAARGLEVGAVMERLTAAAAEAPGERDWSRATMTELADHIEGTHHAFLKTELPRLAGLIEKVGRAHGARHPELARVRVVFMTLAEEMFAHMEKEERVLFPMLREIERGVRRALDGPIDQMVHEHDQAGALLGELRELTGGFTPPAEACTSFRVMLSGLAALEKDLHAHVHKENNILFPAGQRSAQDQRLAASTRTHTSVCRTGCSMRER